MTLKALPVLADAALAASLALIGMYVGRARASGARALGSIPPGYELSLVGLFVMADFGHAAWRLTLGDSTPELDVIHVLLTSGLVLVLGGPARATWRRAGSRFTPAPSRGLPVSPDVLAVLTPREQEVVALVAQGYTNRRIAETLVISERTAEGHVERIRGKLGYTSRAQIAAWAAQQGPVLFKAC